MLPPLNPNRAEARTAALLARQRRALRENRDACVHGRRPVDCSAHAGDRPLPSGEVTFLFTDVEGSTRLFRQLGDRYPAALALHNTIIRAALGAHGGAEVKNEGDSFFFAFASAGDAARGAMAAQRALAAAVWPEGVALPVRIGIHTGLATPSDSDYVSLEVHRAARVTAAARGGEVILSEPASALVAGDGGVDCRLVRIGRVWLKDFDEAESLYVLLDPAA